MGKIIRLNEEEVKLELGEMVRKSVEEMLNAMLDARGERNHTGAQVRAHRKPIRYASRSLPQITSHESRPSRPKSAEAAYTARPSLP